MNDSTHHLTTSTIRGEQRKCTCRSHCSKKARKYDWVSQRTFINHRTDDISKAYFNIMSHARSQIDTN